MKEKLSFEPTKSDLDFIKKNHIIIEEGDDAHIAIMKFIFSDWMKDAEEVVVMPEISFGHLKYRINIEYASHMGVCFVQDIDLCVTPFELISKSTAEHEDTEVDFNNWGYMVIDEPYITRDNFLDGVQKWLDKYYPELAKLPLRYPDELTERRVLRYLWSNGDETDVDEIE